MHMCWNTDRVTTASSRTRVHLLPAYLTENTVLRLTLNSSRNPLRLSRSTGELGVMYGSAVGLSTGSDDNSCAQQNGEIRMR
jgi:hypothetical protein